MIRGKLRRRRPENTVDSSASRTRGGGDLVLATETNENTMIDSKSGSDDKGKHIFSLLSKMRNIAEITATTATSTPLKDCPDENCGGKVTPECSRDSSSNSHHTPISRSPQTPRSSSPPNLSDLSFASSTQLSLTSPAAAAISRTSARNSIDQVRCKLFDVSEVNATSGSTETAPRSGINFDDDSSSTSSEASSLVESCSSEEDETWLVESGEESRRLDPHDELRAILREFKERDRVSNRILSDENPHYKAMMLANEMAARQKRLFEFYQRHPEAVGGASDNKKATEEMPLAPSLSRVLHNVTASKNKHSKPSSVQLIQQLARFEYRHSLVGYTIVLTYCFGHVALASLVDTLMTSALWSFEEWSANQIYAVFIIMALLAMRVDGYLWHWLPTRSYEQVKMEMHNRHILDYWDARLLAYFRFGPFASVESILSMVAFYGAYFGAAFFYNEMFAAFENGFWAWQWQQEKAVGAILTCDIFAMIERPTLSNRIAEYFCVPPNSLESQYSILPAVALNVFFTSVPAFAMVACWKLTLFER